VVLNFKVGKLDMGFSARRGIADGVAIMLILLFVGSAALAQAPKSNDDLKNIDLCNGMDRSSPEPQIRGCTALIRSGDLTKNALAIAYNNRGNAFTAKGAYDLAIVDFDQSIKYNPTYANAFSNRGVANLKKGEYDRALENLNEAIKLDPTYALAFANRAETYQKKNDFDHAARDYDEALRLMPDFKTIWSGRCWIRAVLGELQAALADCNKALQFEPNYATTYDAQVISLTRESYLAVTHDARGLIYLKMGQFDSAIDDYSSALRFDASLASALYGRGLAKRKKGDASGADADIAAAKTIQAKIGDDFVRYGVQ
jgi:tetratricopeptide (TPR) repeat protein